MEKAPSYTPSQEEINKAEGMAEDSAEEQRIKILDLCRKMDDPLKELASLLQDRYGRGGDALTNQSRGYELSACEDIKKALAKISRTD